MVEGTAPTPDVFTTRVRNYEIVGRYVANLELDGSIAGVSQRQRHAYRLPVSRLGWSLKRVTDGGKERPVRGLALIKAFQSVGVASHFNHDGFPWDTDSCYGGLHPCDYRHALATRRARSVRPAHDRLQCAVIVVVSDDDSHLVHAQDRLRWHGGGSRDLECPHSDI